MTALGFFWALGGRSHLLCSCEPLIKRRQAVADRRDLLRFSVDLGKLALCIAEKHGTSSDKWLVLFLLPANTALLLIYHNNQSCSGLVLRIGVGV